MLQLVRVLEAGVDVEGDGARDLDPGRIYYVGHSLGSTFGVPLVAVEPAIRAAVFNVAGGPLVETAPSASGCARAARGIRATDERRSGRRAARRNTFPAPPARGDPPSDASGSGRET